MTARSRGRWSADRDGIPSITLTRGKQTSRHGGKHRPPPLCVESSALFLDVDGTLLDFEDHPDHVAADAELINNLLLLNQRLRGALALVTGRTLVSLDQVFAPHRFTAAGAHGAQLRQSDGRLSLSAARSLSPAAREKVRKFCDATSGVFAEHKPLGAGLHYRLAPKHAEVCRRFLEQLAIEGDHEHRVLAGNMVYELVPRGIDKGTAVLHFLAQAPFAQRQPVFVGDDVPDESAFKVVNELGGVSIRVGQHPMTSAHYGLRDVGRVRAWLRDSLRPFQRRAK